MESMCLSQQISDSSKERTWIPQASRSGFGAYDFLERDDDIIFLECNPGGAWLWLGRATGIKVSEHIARYLLKMDETDYPEKWTVKWCH